MTEAPAAQASSEAPAPAPTTQAAPAPNPTSRSAITRGPGGPKFLPRAIRRSQETREAIAAQEAAKQESKAALDARQKRTGRGGPRRARGGPPTHDRVIRGTSGGFGSDIQASANRELSPSFRDLARLIGADSSIGGQASGFGRLYDFGSTGGSGGGGSGGGFSGIYSGGRSAVKSEGGGFNESTRPTGRRMNTDKIVDYEIMSAHDDVDTKNKDKDTPLVLLPKGMMREEPKEVDQPEIATTAEMEAAERGEPTATIIASSSSDDEDPFYNDNDTEMKDDGRKWPGAKEERAVKIEGEDITEIDTLTQRRAQRKEQIKAEKAEKKKKKYADFEDQMQDEKLAFQRRLFGVDSDGDSDEEEQKGVKETRKPAIVDGAVYLWQFPPVMPPLHKVDKTKAQGPVKDEPSDDVAMSNVPSHGKNEQKPLDLTEDDGDKKGQLPAEEEEELSGFVGKLMIRKSGKMQMDWGGMLFDVSRGIPVSHYREAVLTEEDDVKKPDGFHGTAYGMGQVMGKFNAAPHWSDEKPWVVPASKLPPWGVDAAPEGWEQDPVARAWMDKHEKKRKK